MVVGFDRNINYYKIQYATLCIYENPGCLFIATNRDAVTHLTDAQEWAGGCLCKPGSSDLAAVHGLEAISCVLIFTISVHPCELAC